MREVHEIPGGIPAQELVDRVTEMYERRRDPLNTKKRFWAIREEIIYWGTDALGTMVASRRHNPDAAGVLAWALDRVSLHSGGTTVATLVMNTASDLVYAVSVDGEIGYGSIRDLLDVLRQLNTDPLVTDVRARVVDDDMGSLSTTVADHARQVADAVGRGEDPRSVLTDDPTGDKARLLTVGGVSDDDLADLPF